MGRQYPVQRGHFQGPICLVTYRYPTTPQGNPLPTVSKRYGSIEIRILIDLYINRVSIRSSGWTEILYNGRREHCLHAFQEPRDWTEQQRRTPMQERDPVLRSATGLKLFEPVPGVKRGRFMMSTLQPPWTPFTPYGLNDAGITLRGYVALVNQQGLQDQLTDILPRVGVHAIDIRPILAHYAARLRSIRRKYGI